MGMDQTMQNYYTNSAQGYQNNMTGYRGQNTGYVNYADYYMNNIENSTIRGGNNRTVNNATGPYRTQNYNGNVQSYTDFGMNNTNSQANRMINNGMNNQANRMMSNGMNNQSNSMLNNNMNNYCSSNVNMNNSQRMVAGYRNQNHHNGNRRVREAQRNDRMIRNDGVIRNDITVSDDVIDTIASVLPNVETKVMNCIDNDMNKQIIDAVPDNEVILDAVAQTTEDNIIENNEVMKSTAKRKKRGYFVAATIMMLIVCALSIAYLVLKVNPEIVEESGIMAFLE